MPAVSEKRKLHLEYLNSNPGTIATRFKKGFPAWNRQGLFINCSICDKKTKTIKYRIERGHRFCSKSCADKGRLSPKKDEVISLYNLGLTYKQISEKLNKPIGTIGGLVYRYKLKNRFGNGAFPKDYLKSQLPSFCELCGFIRALDLAHIIPQSKGGPNRLSNLLILCPNCHHLFDHDLLIQEEKEKIARIIEVRRYATQCK